MIELIDKVNKGVDKGLESIVEVSLVFLLIPYLEAKYLFAPLTDMPNVEWCLYPLAIIINFVLFIFMQKE